MQKQVRIQGGNYARYGNALHTSFHEAHYALVSAVPAADLKKWKIDTLLPQWRAHIDTELDINRQSQASNDTKLITQQDQQRDALITYIFERIRVDRLYAPLPALKEAAARLHTTTKVYSGLQREAYQEQSVHTDGLLTDLVKAENAKDILTLSLDAYVSQLKVANDSFKQLYATRSAAKVQTALPNARVQRPLTDAVFQQVCQYLSAAFIYGTEDERERINYLIRMMNQRTDEHKTRHKQATGQGSGSSGSNSGGITPPTFDPNDPENEPKADGE